MQKLNKYQTSFLILIILALTIYIAGFNNNITGMIYSSSSRCGNSICENDESIGNCAIDCLHGCGDGVCEKGEEHLCLEDCVYGPKITYFRLNNVLVSAVSFIALLIIIYWISPNKTIKKAKKQRKKKH